MCVWCEKVSSAAMSLDAARKPSGSNSPSTDGQAPARDGRRAPARWLPRCAAAPLSPVTNQPPNRSAIGLR